MSDPFAFSDTLSRFVEAAGYTPGRLAKLADLPKSTLVNWLNGRVKRPRHWEPLLQLGCAMRLTPAEMNSLLAATDHAPLRDLIPTLDREQRAALPTTWLTPQAAPFQPPPDTAHFVGRAALLDELQTALQRPRHDTVYLLQGMGGIGKTAVAARLAYRCRPFFTDGVLWAQVNEVNPMATLQNFAAAYGRDVSAYTTLADRSRAVRGLLAHKRVLLVLDNAESSAQLRPLLPPTGRAAVLITTRRHDLAVAAGAQRWSLPPLDADAAAQLFTRFGIRAAAQTVSALAETVGHHPLALTIAAGRLAVEPAWTAAQFLDRLTETRHRLHTLTMEDVSVRATFDLSVDRLTSAERAFFAAVGIFAGPFTAAAACAAAAVDERDGAAHLRRLVTLSLVQSAPAERYVLHPLLRTFAQTMGTDAAVFERTAEHYTRFLQTHRRQPTEIAAVYDNVRHLLATAVTAGQQQHTLPLIMHLAPYWTARGFYDEAAVYLARGLAAATADQTRAALLRHRGELARLQQQMAPARRFLQAGLQLARPDDRLRAEILAQLGVVANCEGDGAAATAYFERALAVPGIEEHGPVLALVLEELGITAVVEGAYDTAVALYERGLAAIDDHLPGGINLRKSLGAVYFLRGEYEAAAAVFTAAWALACHSHYRLGETLLLNNLAAVNMVHGQRREAVAQLEQAYDLANVLNHAKPQALIAANLGHVYLLLGRRAQAEQMLLQAQADTRRYGMGTVAGKVGRLLDAAGTVPADIVPSVFI